MGAIVYEHLLEVHERIPFPLEDRFKLWLPDRQTRERLEGEARVRPLQVAQQYRMYPEIIDTTAIRSARVEAMLRGSRPEGRNDDSVLPTFYIELHPSPTE